jgi:hypothetical protein
VAHASGGGKSDLPAPDERPPGQHADRIAADPTCAAAWTGPRGAVLCEVTRVLETTYGYSRHEVTFDRDLKSLATFNLL